MSEIIQSNQQAADSSSQTLVANAQSLQQREIQRDMNSNITAKSESAAAYDAGMIQKASYRNALSQDAEHIATLGKTFNELDSQISAMLSSGI